MLENPVLTNRSNVNERRRKLRFPLRCQVKLRKPDLQRDQPSLGETVDVSSLGFYSVVDHLFRPGEHLDCELRLPVETARPASDNPKLKCKVVVLRSDERHDGSYGLACMITSYVFCAAESAGEQN